MGLVSFIILILGIAVGMYMQKYILLLSIAQSQPAHTHLQHVIRLTVSASRSSLVVTVLQIRVKYTLVQIMLIALHGAYVGSIRRTYNGVFGDVTERRVWLYNFCQRCQPSVTYGVLWENAYGHMGRTHCCCRNKPSLSLYFVLFQVLPLLCKIQTLRHLRLPPRWRSALFWDITQRRVVILYWRFGTTYRSHLEGSRSPGSQNADLFYSPSYTDQYGI